ncbi:DUF943 family protein [Paramixta manurensis]|uniref:DUF943 family protein n=1 Tax=Paramixta manurensis TaxID=2740817 RepID=A0A6M8UGX4_9GAMM|nr:DUF943 family protein [Erwiniaceae bacterium PD-1]
MKKYLLTAILIFVSASAGWGWYLKTHPTTLVSTHQEGTDNFMSIILIKNPPLTNKGKLDWWMNNATMFKEKYNIPSPPGRTGYFVIDVFDFADGYKELERYDRLCFDEIKTSKNCIDKNWLMTIRSSRSGKVWYNVDESTYIEKNGKFIKVKEKIKIK